MWMTYSFTKGLCWTGSWDRSNRRFKAIPLTPPTRVKIPNRMRIPIRGSP